MMGLLSGFAIAAMTTLAISVCSVLLGLGLALSLAVCLDRRDPLGWSARCLVVIVRGLPVLIMLALVYYGAPRLLSVFPSGVMSAIVVLALHYGAMSADILRVAVASASKGQTEQGAVLGLSQFQIIRYLIIPEVASRAAPALFALAISLVKYSSIASVISVHELTRHAELVALKTSDPISAYLTSGLFYLLITIPISLLGLYVDYWASSARPGQLPDAA